ncbi:MAG: 6-bladed beta-propeller [Bacteroidales bacterium]|nr:6-bladed beta-propeller [Bacteroidales bacterium]
MRNNFFKLLGLSCLVAFVIIVAGCHEGDSTDSGASLIKLDMESLLQNQQELKLTEIADDIHYISLETNSDVICQPLQYFIRGNRIIIRNRDQTVYLFDAEGIFIRQVGQMGPGPNEYGGIQNLEVSPDGKRLIFYSTRLNKGFVYSPEGEKLGEFKIPYPTWRFASLLSGRYMMISPYGAFSPDSAAFLFYLIDGQGEVLKKYLSSKVIQMMGDFSIGRFVSNPKSVIGYHPFNDTVFSFDQQGNKSAKYLFDFGSKRVPDEAFDDMMKYMQERDQYIYSPALLETAGRLFIRVSHQKKTWLGIYNFTNGSLDALSSEEGKIENDLDGGPDFWPANSDGDKTVYKLLQPVDLVEARDNGDFAEKDFKSPRARKTFETMLQELKEDDNPVIMVVKLK